MPESVVPAMMMRVMWRCPGQVVHEETLIVSAESLEICLTSLRYCMLV